MIPNRGKRNHPIVVQQVPGLRDGSYWVQNRDAKEGGPSPVLRFNQDKVKEELQIRIVLEVKGQ